MTSMPNRDCGHFFPHGRSSDDCQAQKSTSLMRGRGSFHVGLGASSKLSGTAGAADREGTGGRDKLDTQTGPIRSSRLRAYLT